MNTTVAAPVGSVASGDSRWQGPSSAPPSDVALAGPSNRPPDGLGVVTWAYSATLSLVSKAEAACPTSSSAGFNSIPVDGPPVTTPPPHLNGELNLSLRSYAPTTAHLGLVDYGGAADPDAPQLPALFADNRTPAFVRAYQVYNWDWSVLPYGARGSLVTSPPVTYIGIRTTPGERVSIPSRNAEVFGGAYKAMVLYAEQRRITLEYMRSDSIAYGYAIHIENVCVDPNLLALYRSLNTAAGRTWLPALRNGEPLGTAFDLELGVATRDTGSFMDPRSRKDWWKGR